MLQITFVVTFGPFERTYIGIFQRTPKQVISRVYSIYSFCEIRLTL